MKPPGAKADDATLAVVIGSDDPITFATNLPQEYQLTFDAMISAGVSQTGAMEWLDSVRQDSLTYRFTLPESRFAMNILDDK